MIWMEFPIAANWRAHLRPRPLARSGIAGWKSKLWSAWLCLWDFATFSFHCQFNKIVIFCKSNAAMSIEFWYYGSKILFNRQKCTPSPCKRPQQYTFPFFTQIYLPYIVIYIFVYHINICHLWHFTSLDGCGDKNTLDWPSLYFAILL